MGEPNPIFEIGLIAAWILGTFVFLNINNVRDWYKEKRT